MTEPRGPGRPLDRTRDSTILAVTLELFGEVGWDNLTVADVAKRAKVGLSTIYRRWETKSELVAAAIATTLPASTSSADTAVAPEAILEAIRINLTGQRAPYFPGLIAAMRSDPKIAKAIRKAAIDPDRERLRTYVAKALHQDANQDLIDLIADIGPAILVHRAIVIGEPLAPNTTKQLSELIEQVIKAHATHRPST